MSTSLRMTIITDVPCAAQFIYQTFKPLRKARRKTQRGLSVLCGWTVHFSANARLTEREAFDGLAHSFLVTLEETERCVYYCARFWRGGFTPDHGCFSTSPVLKACQYPDKPIVAFAPYVCPPFDAVDPYSFDYLAPYNVADCTPCDPAITTPPP